jgi:hypothetical protein
MLAHAVDVYPGSSQFLRDTIGAFSKLGFGAIVTCVIIVLWAGSWVFAVIERAVNRIWGATSRTFWHGRALTVGMVGLVGLLLALSVILTSALVALREMTARLSPRQIARRSRGTPRIVTRLLRRVRDYAEVDYDGRITQAVASDALNRMEVDTYGLDEMDRKLLLTIIEKFNGGPVGLGTISASIHEEKDSIEEIIEPYLIQIGFLDRTPRGRCATPLAYEHFGVKAHGYGRPSLFDPR